MNHVDYYLSDEVDEDGTPVKVKRTTPLRYK